MAPHHLDASESSPERECCWPCCSQDGSAKSRCFYVSHCDRGDFGLPWLAILLLLAALGLVLAAAFGRLGRAHAGGRLVLSGFGSQTAAYRSLSRWRGLECCLRCPGKGGREQVIGSSEAPPAAGICKLEPRLVKMQGELSACRLWHTGCNSDVLSSYSCCCW